MSNKTNTFDLIQEIQKNRELYSPFGEKPQGLQRSEIIERVKGFLIEQEKLRNSIAFGEGVAVGNTGKNIAQFDPIESYKKNPSAIDNIMMLVNYDMDNREEELIVEAENFKGSYNTLLFGIAIKVAHDQNLSPTLKEFLFDHLISPPDDQKKSLGRPKKTTLDEEFRYHAIEFARLHGLKATRNDESTSFSACDAVSDAATALSQSRVPGFNQGFGFEVLKKIWAKHSK